jgi:hypothetical protein
MSIIRGVLYGAGIGCPFGTHFGVRSPSTKHYTEGQTIQWPTEKGQTMIYKAIHRRTDNTMDNRKRTNNNLQNNTQKDRQYNGQKKKDIICPFSVGHCIVCPSV